MRIRMGLFFPFFFFSLAPAAACFTVLRRVALLSREFLFREARVAVLAMASSSSLSERSSESAVISESSGSSASSSGSASFVSLFGFRKPARKDSALR